MHSTRMALVIGGALCAATSVAGAQRGDDIPPYMQPSPGMCRVWVDGLPANRQQPQTDCDTARRNLPRNARIIWGRQDNGSRNDPRHAENAGSYDSRDDRWSVSDRERAQRIRLERERVERERRREAWERARLARERREREEQRRREEWRRSHHDKNDDRDRGHGHGNDEDRRGNGRSSASVTGDPRHQ